MENSWSLFNTQTNSNNSTSAASSSNGGQNGPFTNNSWETWDLGNTRYDWNHSLARNQQSTPCVNPGSSTGQDNNAFYDQGHSFYASGSHYYNPDPHLACLNLGKRHYFANNNERHPTDEKRGRPAVVAGPGVPTCQVDGCHVALMEAKEYHRRHKVCEMHSKAPRVVVLGAEQRFCQQCSRFHAISEFDDSKRSCRRRLAGHNERRRKGSHENALIPRNSSQGRALSLLSSTNNMWLSSSADLSTRSSAALHDLIAENRASNFARQIVLDRNWSNNQYNNSTQNDTDINYSHNQFCSESNGWDQYNEDPNGQVTLDLMQAQNSAFGLLSMGGKSKEQDEGCSELVWRSLGGSREM